MAFEPKTSGLAGKYSSPDHKYDQTMITNMIKIKIWSWTQIWSNYDKKYDNNQNMIKYDKKIWSKLNYDKTIW